MNEYKDLLERLVAAYDEYAMCDEDERMIAFFRLGDVIHQARELLGHVKPLKVIVADQLQTGDRVGG